MKLLIITAVKAFENDIKQILKSAEVSSYTYKDVKGYRDASELSIQENWFANEMNESEALFFYAFVKKENVDVVFDKVKEFNKNQGSLSSVHVATLNIEKII
jgi:nitrogen regulatory protein PII